MYLLRTVGELEASTLIFFQNYRLYIYIYIWYSDALQIADSDINLISFKEWNNSRELEASYLYYFFTVYIILRQLIYTRKQNSPILQLQDKHLCIKKEHSRRSCHIYLNKYTCIYIVADQHYFIGDESLKTKFWILRGCGDSLHSKKLGYFSKEITLNKLIFKKKKKTLNKL